VSENIIEGIQRQCERVRKLIPLYESIGSAGAFSVSLMRYSIQSAEEAIASGDTLAMFLAYKDLEGYE